MVNKKLSRPGKINGNFKNGRTMKKYTCIDCNDDIHMHTALYGKGRCSSCAIKEINTKGGIHKTLNYCCKDCGDHIHYNCVYYGTGCCSKCYSNYRRDYKGERNPNWKESLTNFERINRRNIPENEEFIKKIFIRDNHLCQICNNGGDLIAHHLEGYHWCEQLRFSIDNGVTLCNICHDNFHKKFTNFYNTTEQFIKFLGYKI